MLCKYCWIPAFRKNNVVGLQERILFQLRKRPHYSDPKKTMDHNVILLLSTKTLRGTKTDGCLLKHCERECLLLGKNHEIKTRRSWNYIKIGHLPRKEDT